MGGFWTKILEDQHRPFIKNPLGRNPESLLRGCLPLLCFLEVHAAGGWAAGLLGALHLRALRRFFTKAGNFGSYGSSSGGTGSRLSRVECWRARPACRPTGPLFFGKTLILVRYPNCLGRCGPSVRPTGCNKSSSGVPTRRSKLLQLLSRLQCTFNRVNCKQFPKGSQCHIRAIAVMGKPLKAARA